MGMLTKRRLVISTAVKKLLKRAVQRTRRNLAAATAATGTDAVHKVNNTPRPVVSSVADGEQEAEWLVAAGLESLAAPFRAGRELPDCTLEPALRLLPRHQAEAVRRRVRSLNHTVRQRGRRRQRKPDIRDVFRDRDLENSSTGTRSRSATPDSLDSELPCEDAADAGLAMSGGWSSPSPHSSPQDRSPPTPLPHWAAGPGRTLDRGSPPTPPPSFVQIFHPVNMRAALSSSSHKAVRRLPSAPAAPAAVLPVHELFRGAYRGSFYGGDIVASDCAEGIEMINYQRIGSMHLSKYRTRSRIPETLRDRSADHTLSSSAPSSNHDLTADMENSHNTSLRRNLLIPHASITRSQSSVYERERDAQQEARRSRSGSQGHLSFEEVCRQRTLDSSILAGPASLSSEKPESGRTWMEFLSEADHQKLYPLLLLEVTALFDSCGLSFRKRKPSKRKRKEEGNIFGVSLATLLERDQQLCSEHSKVPLFVQKLVSQLEKRGLQEEGVLRVAAHRLKVDTLTGHLEESFYSRPDQAEKVLESASVHELAALLKKWLRDLPQPLLTPELVALFYRTHELPVHLRARALNLLVLLLPAENRATLKVLVDFLNRVVKNQETNKMSLHNVAMIAAPSLFPPRYVESAAAASSGNDKASLSSQVSLAAVCCQVSEGLLQAGEGLWMVPSALVGQVRRSNEQDRQRRQAKENKPMKRLLGRRNASNTLSKEQNESRPPPGVDSSGALRISAPQFGLNDFPVVINERTTAGAVVLSLVEEISRDPDAALNMPSISARNDKNQRRPNSMYGQTNPAGASHALGHSRGNGVLQLAHNANLSCLLATADSELALKTHFLYEVGGNIGERQLEQAAVMTTVLLENPNASWVLRCHHRNGNNPLLGVSNLN
ncbi:hypothetical protein ONE63_000877 [Megalurothrips usitatus]|uniref:Rho-GAP domain-containing protein n=1 Tax=Megalurothrips usitatus TaxID=439358 RepID=A0AAV7Y6V7_9NEOP|nr:hypothetical protein ONE63_000877 [Megalurothrips usitatus]